MERIINVDDLKRASGASRNTILKYVRLGSLAADFQRGGLPYWRADREAALIEELKNRVAASQRGATDGHTS